VTDDIFDALPPEPYCSKCYGVKKAPATRILEDGDVIDLGDRRFEVIHTPGHSPGGIALWEAETETLFSGDILYDGPLIEDTYHSNADDYLASMERLLAIPARTVHGGHFPSFSGEKYRRLVTDWLNANQNKV
jgi:glyoxylase-like metal-dependent hydrolase (beta-lactamase superfamily II)